MRWPRNYLLFIYIFLAIQILVNILLLHVYKHANAIHYFSGDGNIFSVNPIPFANLLILFEAVDVILALVFIFKPNKIKWPKKIASIALLVFVFVIGLTTLNYVYNTGPFGGKYGCMQTPDECGG